MVILAHLSNYKIFENWETVHFIKVSHIHMNELFQLINLGSYNYFGHAYLYHVLFAVQIDRVCLNGCLSVT